MPQIASMRMENYRCFDDVTVRFAKRTVLIGANGAGKTSILEALDKLFGVARRRGYGFQESDLRRGSQEGQPLRITVELRPTGGGRFDATESALFETHIDQDAYGREVVYISCRAEYESDGVFRSRAEYLKVDGNEDGHIDLETRRALTFFYLPTLRDVRQEMGEANGLWARLTALLEEAADPKQFAEIAEESGREIVSAILGVQRMSDIADSVSRLLGHVLYVDDTAAAASLTATPVDHRMLLRRTDLLVSAPGREPLSVREQSTGVQALAMFGLFRAYLDTHAGTTLAVGFEEPEAHLAPHAARSLALMVSENGQSILTTHSPVIADVADLTEVVLVRRHKDVSRVTQVPSDTYSTEERGHLRRIIRRTSSSFLFGRVVWLVEGESEVLAIPEFAQQIGYDLQRLGVTLVSADGPGFDLLATLVGPDCHDIPHMILVDRDETLNKVVKQLIGPGRLPEAIDRRNPPADVLASAGVWRWSTGDLESILVDGGGYEAYETAADALFGVGKLHTYRTNKWEREQGNIDRGQESNLEVLYGFLRANRRKPEMAYEAARAFSTLGLGVPAEVTEHIKHAVGLARRAATREMGD